jgi:hypothetical protein
MGRKWIQAQKPSTPRERRAAKVLVVLVTLIAGTLAIAAANRHNWLQALILTLYTALSVGAWLYTRARRRKTT